MLKVVKENLWEVHNDGTWSKPVVVMLRNCEDTELPIRVCSVCHIGRHGRENMRGVALFLVITYGYSVVGPSPHLGWRSDWKWNSNILVCGECFLLSFLG
jgi:hypothetical protein